MSPACYSLWCIPYDNTSQILQSEEPAVFISHLSRSAMWSCCEGLVCSFGDLPTHKCDHVCSISCPRTGGQQPHNVRLLTFLQHTLSFFPCTIIDNDPQPTDYLWAAQTFYQVLTVFFNKAWLLLLLKVDLGVLRPGALILLALPGLSLLVFEGPPKIFFMKK